MNFKIDPEFKENIPPLTEDEKAQLEWGFHGTTGADLDHRQASSQKIHGPAGQAPDEKGR